MPPARSARHLPSAVSQGFRLRRCRALAPYLARLGISHRLRLALSEGAAGQHPRLRHRRPYALNPELGRRGRVPRDGRGLRRNGLGQILDFVPNHMGVGGADNPLWLDVLEWGPNSGYAGWFDIDWEPDRRYLRDKLLVPFLGEQYGVVLEAGELALKFDEPEATSRSGPTTRTSCRSARCTTRASSATSIPSWSGWATPSRAFPNGVRSVAPARRANSRRNSPRLPRARRMCAGAVDGGGRAAQRRAGRPRQLARPRRADPGPASGARRISASPPTTSTIAASSTSTTSPACAWNCRRCSTTRTASSSGLLKTASSTDLRIDHVDGLLDPKGYLQRLRAKAATTLLSGGREDPGAHEIAARGLAGRGDHRLRVRQPRARRCCVDPAGRGGFTSLYTGVHRRARALRGHRARLQDSASCDNEMASELNVLARDAARVARQNPRTADFTHNVLQRAIARNRRLLPGLSHLCRRGRRAARRMTGAISTGRSHRRAATRPTSIRASSTFCTGSSPAIWWRSRAAASAATRCCAGDEAAAI